MNISSNEDVDFNAKSDSDKLAFSSDVSGDYIEIIRRLIENGADVNCADNFHTSPLMMASKKGHLDVVRMLIEKEAFVNAKDDFDRNVLLYSAKFGDLEITRLLIDNGADVNIKNKANDTALMTAHF